MNTQNIELARSALKRAIQEAGGKSKLARAIGVSPQAIDNWEIVPPLRVRQVHMAVDEKVPLHELRPDLFQLEN